MSALIECPLCDWTHEPEAAKYIDSNLAAGTGVAAALGMPADALLSIHMHQAGERDESTIDRHMRTHPPSDWLPELIRLRVEIDHLHSLLDGYRGDLAETQTDRDLFRSAAGWGDLP